MSFGNSLLEYFVLGGMFMWPLLAESVLALAIIFDRFLAFRANARIDTRSLRTHVLDLLGQDKVREAALLCAQTPGPVSAVLLAALQAYDKHRAVTRKADSLRKLVEDAIEDAGGVAVAAVESRLSVLQFIGNSAPLIGMLGTVTGMITAFGGMAKGGVSSEAVALGIAEALITTAAGLIIALIAVIPFHYFTSRANAVQMEIQEAAGQVLDHIYIRVADREDAPAPQRSPARA